jgi:teichuronic acid biosynthesis glycosyltransferase TuaG
MTKSDPVPEISIVMPAYNASRYIRASIDSVLAQSYVDFELCVIDDCSKDDTPEIVVGYARVDPRVRLMRMEKNRGAPAGPRNAGVRNARGKWIAFLDADDIWHPDKLRCQMEIVGSTGVRFCSTQMRDFVDERELVFTDPGAVKTEQVGFLQQLIKFRTPTSSVLAERELLLRHPFNEDLRFKAREDLDCWLHCLEDIGTSSKILHPMLGYRIIPGQISGKKTTMVRRHFLVLREYRRKNGKALGLLGAAFFTSTHFLLSLYFRMIKKGL